MRIRRPDPSVGAVVGEPIVQLRGLGLKRSEDGSHLLRDIELTVEAGEIVGLVGDSGSGKTVLLDCILRTTPFAHEVAGEIVVDGRNVHDLDEAELDRFRGREVAIIPSGGRQFLSPATRIEKQMVRLLRRHFGVSASTAQAAAMTWLQSVQIPDPGRRLKSFPHELSGGMAQRVLIAMALMREPKLVLADEPTAGLDVTIQKQVLDLLVELLAAQRSACLLVTRDLGIVANYCARVAVLDGGRVAEITATEDFFRSPQSESGRRMLDRVRAERLGASTPPGEAPLDEPTTEEAQPCDL